MVHEIMLLFLAGLQQKNIPGVIFVSGDRHYTEMLKIDRPGNYPLYDITCSAMTSIVMGGPQGKERDNPHRAPGTLVIEHNYCEMKITGTEDKRMITLSSFNGEGKRLWQKQISYAELGL